MSRFLAVKQKRASLLTEARAIADKGDAATAEESARLEAILAEGTGELAALDKELERFAALHAAERTAVAVPDGSPIIATPAAERDPMCGFANAAEFARAVVSASVQGGRVDERLLIRSDRPAIGAAPTGYMTEGGGSAGEGYEVPPQLASEVWSVAFAPDTLAAQLNPEPTDSNAVEIQADESTPWGATGVHAYWRTEGAQLTASKAAEKKRLVKLGELYAYVLAEEELLEDAPRLSARLTTGAGAAIAYKIGDAAFNGNGVGIPLGWMQASCLVSVAKESGQTAATVVAANVAKMYARNINPGRGIWFVNQDVLPQLMTLSLNNNPIWMPPASGFAGAPGGYLFGRPIQFAEQCQTVGTQGDIQFVDLGGYYSAVKRGGPKFAESMHLFFDYNLRAFRWIVRFGGQPFLSAAVSPAKGSSTRSHFVALDTRS